MAVPIPNACRWRHLDEIIPAHRQDEGTAVNHLVPAGDPKRMEYVDPAYQCVRCTEKIS
ncbi:MAG: hypothetical protein ACLTMP_04250 [Eggerthella lenta]